MSDYFGMWSIHDQTFESLVSRINGTNLHVHLQSAEVKSSVASRDRREYEVDRDGIAYFEVSGPMMKSVPSMADGTSYVRLRQQINAARRDPEVLGGLVVADTPGGTVRGNEDLVQDLAKFADAKPITWFTEDMTCSAGVSLASQCTKRYANNATAYYGSMGTYAVIQDLSGMAEKLGVKVHVIKAGDFKGTGTPGTEVTEEQLSDLQRIVSTLNENYLGLIASGLGRPVDSIRGLADGRVILASDAVSAGLIDGIASLDEAKQELVGMVSASVNVSMSNTRSQEPMDKTPATLKELKQTFPGSTAEWRESQLEAGNDLRQAAIDYAQYVEQQAAAERDELQKKLDEAEQKAKANQTASQPQSSGLGHAPLSVDSLQDAVAETGDVVSDFDSHVRDYMIRNRCSRLEAIKAVKRRNPEMAKQFLLATNTSMYGQRTLKERFDALKV